MKKRTIFVLVAIIVVGLLFAYNQGYLEVIPSSLKTIVSIGGYSDYDATKNIYLGNSDWVALKFTYPDDPDINCIVKAGVARRTMLSSNCFKTPSLESGISKTLTMDTDKWDFIERRSAFGFSSGYTLLLNNDNFTSYHPGETLYLITHFVSNGNCGDHTYLKWAMSNSSKYPEYETYYANENGVYGTATDGFINTRDEWGKLFNFRVWGGWDTDFFVDFDYSPKYPVVANDIQFTDTSQQDLISKTVWDFGDYSPVSEEKNPVHFYTYPRDYIVTLTGTSYGGKVLTKEKTITVYATIPKGNIYVTCKNIDGSPLINTQVILKDIDTDNITDVSITDDDGKATFVNIPYGSYRAEIDGTQKTVDLNSAEAFISIIIEASEPPIEQELPWYWILGILGLLGVIGLFVVRRRI